jgi:hypothetical protein
MHTRGLGAEHRAAPREHESLRAPVTSRRTTEVAGRLVIAASGFLW